MAEQSDKKIIIDEDWKEEAQREKEMLAKAQEEAREVGQRATERPPLPPASFAVLASSLAVQAMAALGDMQDAKGQRSPLQLDEAKFHIDMLEMLQDKTRNNLAPDEKKMLEELLFDLRMRFVSKSKGQP